MAFIGAGDLRERVQVRELIYDPAADAWGWETAFGAWAKAEQSDKTCLFSSVGIGARSVGFTMRKTGRLTLANALLWRGQFCFLSSIADAAQPGMMEVKAALCQTVDCQKDVDSVPPGCKFPGVLTEKYLGHQQETPMGVTTTTLVLVTPKAIALGSGSLVEADGKDYEVLVRHTLDPWKNEYEIRRKEDC